MIKQKKPPDPEFSSRPLDAPPQPPSTVSVSPLSSPLLHEYSRVSWQLMSLSLRWRSFPYCLFRICRYSSTILGRFEGFFLASYGRSTSQKAFNLSSSLCGWISRIHPFRQNLPLSFPIYCRGGIETLSSGSGSKSPFPTVCGFFLFTCGYLGVIAPIGFLLYG